VFDASGRGVEYLSALYRPDMHCIRMELTRAGRGTDRYWMALRPQRQAKTTEKTTGKQKRSSPPGRRNAA